MRRLLVGLAALALAGGCGGPKFYPVRGEVIVFGVGRLPDGEVKFRPVDKPDLVATGRVKDGRFELSTPGHEGGVLEGPCKAAVVAGPQKGRAVVADRYADFDTSELQFTVTARDENYFMIEVRTK